MKPRPITTLPSPSYESSAGGTPTEIDLVNFHGDDTLIDGLAPVHEDDEALSPSRMPVSELRKHVTDATRVRLDVAIYESLCEDVSYVSECLDSLTCGLRKGSGGLEHYVIPPSILLFPIPSWDKETNTLHILVHALDFFESDPKKMDESLKPLLSIPKFPRANYLDECVKKGISFEEKVNLIKAIMVYLEDVSGIETGAEKGLSVNYEEAADLLLHLVFDSPTPETPDTFDYQGRKIVIGDVNLEEFKARLCSYLQQKGDRIYREGKNAESVVETLHFSPFPSGNGTITGVSYPKPSFRKFTP